MEYVFFGPSWDMMLQAAKSGRGAGFERKIRRQVKQIEVGYFLLGEEGEIG